jgi:hypothetical protein
MEVTEYVADDGYSESCRGASLLAPSRLPASADLEWPAMSHDQQPQNEGYAALLELLPTLHHLVDACGEVWLTGEEAARIEKLGFPAQAGRWHVPPVPPELVAGNPLLEHLSIGWRPPQTAAQPPSDNPSSEVLGREEPVAPQVQLESEASAGQQSQTLPMRSSSTSAVGDSVIEQLETKILAVIERHGGQVHKRRLQQTLWRFPAAAFNQAIESLVHREAVNIEGPWVLLHKPTPQATGGYTGSTR